MEIIGIIRQEAKKTQRTLRKRGYISRNYVIDKEYMAKYIIPQYGTLCTMADKGILKAIKVITEGNESYWFDKEQIESYWVPKITNTKTVNNEELYKLRDTIISEIEAQAAEFLGIIDKAYEKENLLTKQKVTITCPYSIRAAQYIFTEGVEATIKAVGNKIKYNIEYNKKVLQLDAMTGKNADLEE